MNLLQQQWITDIFRYNGTGNSNSLGQLYNSAWSKMDKKVQKKIHMIGNSHLIPSKGRGRREWERNSTRKDRSTGGEQYCSRGDVTFASPSSGMSSTTVYLCKTEIYVPLTFSLARFHNLADSSKPALRLIFYCYYHPVFKAVVGILPLLADAEDKLG